MKTLLLRCNAPLQSWGTSSVYDRRDTDDMPSKSGIIGILAAALGRKRGESLEDLNSISFGVRIDDPGRRIEDYQVTEMGAKLKPNSSNRGYLCDATFLVGISSEDDALIEKLEFAVSHPVFSVYLGRKSCPPVPPFNLGIRNNDLYDALRSEKWQVSEWKQKKILAKESRMRLRIITDAKTSGSFQRDVPISFSPFFRDYEYRMMKERESVFVVNDRERQSTHDAMAELR